MDTLINVFLILIVIFLVFSMGFTLYVRFFKKELADELDKNTKEKYLNRVLKLLEKYKKKAILNPNKNYEIGGINYFGILRDSSKEPLLSKDYLTDGDLEKINNLFENSEVI